MLGVLNLAPGTEPWVLEVEAMNEPRFESLVDTVAAADPGARLREQTRTPAAELIAQAQENSFRPSQPVDPTEPEIAAALDEHIRGYEQQWLDEAIPALGGHTPRECAADPTRRDDLIRLLDSYPQQERPGAMSAGQAAGSIRTLGFRLPPTHRNRRHRCPTVTTVARCSRARARAARWASLSGFPPVPVRVHRVRSAARCPSATGTTADG